MSSAIFKVDTEVPPSYYEKLFDFIYTYYLVPQKQRFSRVFKEISPNGSGLHYSIIDEHGKEILTVNVKGTHDVTVEIISSDPNVPSTTIHEARQDILIATQMFEEKARKTTWYFAWREGEQIVPEKVTAQEKTFNRLFLETQILFFLVFIVLGMGLFIVLFSFYSSWFWVAPLILIVVQLGFVFYSSKIIARSGDWTITKENPILHLIEYQMPVGIL
jgi:heat shock protein HtpX